VLTILEKHIQSQKLFSKNQSLLLAVSGGVDSVVLSHLLSQLNYKITLAHCNFKLRGKESEDDEKFCRDLAKKLNLKIHVHQFDIKSYSKKNKVSIQMAARDLRYAWFDQLIKEQHYNLLLTAHHADDSVETILLNLIRGSGLKGLAGMQAINGHVIRPLLNFSKKEIESYAEKHKIKFRKDSSNDEDKYKRNFVRLKLIPQIQKLNPAFNQTLLANAHYLAEDLNLLKTYIQIKRQALVIEKNNQYLINIQNLLKETNLQALTVHLLEHFGFNASQVEDLISTLNSKNFKGKLFATKAYIMHVGDKELMIIKNIQSIEIKHVYHSLQALKSSQLLKTQSIKKFALPHRNELLIESKHLIFPLTIRQRITGDKFKPFGMNGFKLLSDFYKEQKLNAVEKDNTKLLVNGNGDIIWVIGYRSDERYRVNEKSKNILKLTQLGQ